MKVKILFALLLSISMLSFAQTSKKSYEIKTLENVKGDAILPAITTNYKGSVTLIDFWATWCPPCRAALTEIDKIKASYIKKGVKFVYVTGETSPKDKWSKMIQTIDGDHFRLSNDEWTKLGKNQKMRGIPCYVLLKKDGTIAFSNITSGGYPGNIKMGAEMDKALKE